jgi:anti-sigma B factor antagonist
MQEVSLLETMDSGDAIIANVMHDKLFEETLVDNIANQLYRLIDQNSGARLVLDLSNVVMVCSSMLGKLITVNKKVNATGGSLCLCGVTPHVYEILAVTKLNRLLSICDTPQQAVESI